MNKSLDGAYAPFVPARGSALRHVAALALHRVSRLFARWARQLRCAPALKADVAPLALEFHAEAGAAEGALYVNGQLVGYLQGVNRL